MNGTVKDPTGAVVAGATVTLRDIATNREVTSTTNDEGFFVFQDVRPGLYVVAAERAGFKRAEVQNVQANVDQPSTVNIVMEVGQPTETVTITAAESQAVVNTENAQLATTVLGRQIEDLPLNGRNPLSLAGLQAGVNTGSSNRTAAVNGLRGTFTNLTWDGVNINDNFIRTDSFFGAAAPSVVSVSEFTLVTQNANAGDGLGVAQVKLVTPRGGREFHGSIFDYHRNDRFDANTFFNNALGRYTATDAQVVAGLRQAGEEKAAKPLLNQNQFGFNFSGPFVLPRFGEGGPATYGKDRLFFYGFYEGVRDTETASTTRTFLTQNARTGLFTYRRLDNGQLQTINLLSVTGRQLDPLTSSLANAAPLPNDPTTGDLASVSGGAALSNFATFRYNTPVGFSQDLWGFRTDFDYSERHRFEAIFNQFLFNFPNSGGEPFPGAPGDGQSSTRPRGSFAWNWTASSSLNNELRFGFFNQDVVFFTNEPFSRGFQIVQPLISDSEDNFLPQGRLVKNKDLLDNAVWTKGDHTFRFGGSYRNVYVQPFNDAGIVPTVNIGFTTTGIASPLSRTNAAQFPGGIGTTDFSTAGSVLAILTGPISSITQTFNVANREDGFVPGATQRQKFHYFGVGSYVQDTWRLRQNLTVNFGVRHEFISVPREAQGLVLLPTNRELTALRENVTLDFASGGDRGFFNNDYNNFAPNFSFAWDPFKDGKTSLRGGYAISYVIDNNITTVLNAVRGNPGLISTVSRTAVKTTAGAGPPVIPTPAFKVPRTALDNVTLLDPASAYFTFDPNFRTPYVQQWNIGIEREVMRDTAVEVRYVGNRGTKLTRGIDSNQLRVFNNGFAADVARAQFNLANCGGRANPTAAQCAGRQPLQILPFLGDNLGLNGFLTDPSVILLIQQGQLGALAQFYAGANSFFFVRDGASSKFGPEFFLPNPNSFIVDYYSNAADSWYHGLQAEVRRRLNNGLYFQANYTYSKAMSNFEGSQSNFAGLMDLTAGSALEKRRIVDDITHVFKANWVYELPLGPGKQFMNYGGVTGKILGGWSLNGLLRWQSGEPISIVSARATVNRAGRSGNNTVITSLSNSAIQQQTGLFFDAQGRPVMFDPALIAAVRANPDNNAYFTNPGLGQFGNLGLTPVSGPSTFFLDASLIKRTNITERVNVEFRAEAFNLLNHTNFNLRDNPDDHIQNINSASFGRIQSTFAPRILQFALKLNF
ncbi:MAG TPA: TonB-dependent receptor [Pyrinomonadaceae bacterium]